MAILLNRVTDESFDAVGLPVSREKLWTLRWRGTAADGTEVAVALESPAKQGMILASLERSFRIEQEPEEVVAIAMPAESEMAAKIGWYLGNRHLPIEVRKEEIVLANFATLTDSLDRIGIRYEVRQDILLCRPHSEEHRH